MKFTLDFYWQVSFYGFPAVKPPRYVLSLKVFGARRYTKILATIL